MFRISTHIASPIRTRLPNSPRSICLPAIPRWISTSRTLQSSNNQEKVSHKNKEILKLVPDKGKATIITADGRKLERFSVFRFLNKELDAKKHELVVVSMKKTPTTGDATVDPTLVCKVVPISETMGTAATAKARYKEQKKASSKSSASGNGPQAVKEKNVPISWTIGASDLKGQKRLAIESVLSRGHKAIVQMQSKSRRQDRNLTELELERRQKVVEQIKEICDEYGTAYKRPTGSIEGQYVLYYQAN